MPKRKNNSNPPNTKKKKDDNYDKHNKYDKYDESYKYDKYGNYNNNNDNNNYNKYGFNKYGFNKYGFDKCGVDKYGFNKYGFDKYGYDRFGYDVHGVKKVPQNKKPPNNKPSNNKQPNKKPSNNKQPNKKPPNKKPPNKKPPNKKPPNNKPPNIQGFTSESSKLLHILFDIPPYVPPRQQAPQKKESEVIKVRVVDDNDYFKTDDKLYPIEMKINTLDDLIKLAKKYDATSKKKYVINMKVLNRCLDTLIELNNMIGMESIKNNIINLFFFYLQNFYGDEKKQMLHTIIEGTPGSGKTEVAKIMAKLYYNLGIVKTNKFIIARRSDLIGKYLGHTAANTQKIFNDAENGVIFIDEAYSLGNKMGTDSFSKECIDTINQNLTEKKGKVIVIIAGYKKQLMESFFSYNPGLLRRFPFRYTINSYSADDLMKIYLKMMKDDKWTLYDKSITIKFFEKNKPFFKYNGGDMEILWGFTKITHARRVFGLDINKRKKINQTDLDQAFKLFASNDEVKNRNNRTEIDRSLRSMYL